MKLLVESTTVTLGRAEALVLFDLLADFDQQNCLALREEADRVALLRLHAALEQTLVEPLQPQYGQLLHEARATLAPHAEAA